jgi:hypothetical protein
MCESYDDWLAKQPPSNEEPPLQFTPVSGIVDGMPVSGPGIEPGSKVVVVYPPRKGRPRIEDKGKSFEATKPWIALGMSRRTWYSRRKEQAAILMEEIPWLPGSGLYMPTWKEKEQGK